MTDVPADPVPPSEMLRAACSAFADVVRPLEDEESWRSAGCTGWAARDLIPHRVADCRLALVALHTTAAVPLVECRYSRVAARQAVDF